MCKCYNAVIRLLGNRAQYSTAQHSTAQHSTAQHSTAQYSTAQYSTGSQFQQGAKSKQITSEVRRFNFLTFATAKHPTPLDLVAEKRKSSRSGQA